MKNLGTKIETLAKPVARGIDAIWGSELSNCGGCNKMRDNLDAGRSLAGAFYDRFWGGIPLALNKGENMVFVIQLDVGEADNVEQALKQIAQGTTISVNPNPQILTRAPHVVSIAVEAGSLEEALQKKESGVVMAVGRRPAQPVMRPQPSPPPAKQ